MRYVCAAAVVATVLLAGATAFACPERLASGATCVVPFGIEQALSLRSLPVPAGALSPDGELLAYVPLEKEETQGLWPFGLGARAIELIRVSTGEKVETLKGYGRYWAPSWSPGGDQLAFLSDRDGAIQIWLWDRASGSMRRVSEATYDIVWPFQWPVWTPDGSTLVARVKGKGIVGRSPRGAWDPQSNKEGALSPSVKVLESTTAERIDEQLFDLPNARFAADLVLVNVKDGTTRRIATNEVVGWYGGVSPDGESLAYFRQGDVEVGSGQLFGEVVLASLKGGPSKVIANRVPMTYGRITWSPDSTRFAYWSEHAAHIRTAEPAQIFVFDTRTGTHHQTILRDQRRFAPYYGATKELVPYWTPDGHSILFAADGSLWQVSATGGAVAQVISSNQAREIMLVVATADGHSAWSDDQGRSILVMTRDPIKKTEGFARVELRSGDVRMIAEDERHLGGFFQEPLTSRDVSNLVYVSEDERNPPDFWNLSPSTGRMRQISRLNPELTSSAFGRSMVVHYQVRGRPFQAALLLPAQYREGTKYPMLVHVYPGEQYQHSRSVHKFGLGNAATAPMENMQVFAARGYAVLAPEIPQRIGTPMEDISDAVNAAVDRVVSLGIADAERLGIFGFSYGGYGTLATIVQTTRFNAAVMGGAAVDLVSMYGHIGEEGRLDGANWLEQSQGMMGALLWTRRELYLRNSPMMFLDRVKTPVLIYHGKEDDAVPIWQSDEVFGGLKRLGRIAQYRKYQNEGHGIMHRENIEDLLEAQIKWFDSWLAPHQ